MEQAHNWTEEPILDDDGRVRLDMDAVQREVDDYAQKAYRATKAAKQVSVWVPAVLVLCVHVTTPHASAAILAHSLTNVSVACAHPRPHNNGRRTPWRRSSRTWWRTSRSCCRWSRSWATPRCSCATGPTSSPSSARRCRATTRARVRGCAPRGVCVCMLNGLPGSLHRTTCQRHNTCFVCAALLLAHHRTGFAPFSVRDLLQYNLLEALPRLQVVGAAASKEAGLEKALARMQGDWEGVAFRVVEYKDTGTCVIGGTDEVQVRCVAVCLPPLTCCCYHYTTTCKCVCSVPCGLHAGAAGRPCGQGAGHARQPLHQAPGGGHARLGAAVARRAGVCACVCMHDELAGAM